MACTECIENCNEGCVGCVNSTTIDCVSLGAAIDGIDAEVGSGLDDVLEELAGDIIALETAVSALEETVEGLSGQTESNYVSNVELQNDTDLIFTGVGDAFDGTIDLSSAIAVATDYTDTQIEALDFDDIIDYALDINGTSSGNEVLKTTTVTAGTLEVNGASLRILGVFDVNGAGIDFATIEVDGFNITPAGTALTDGFIVIEALMVRKSATSLKIFSTISEYNSSGTLSGTTMTNLTATTANLDTNTFDITFTVQSSGAVDLEMAVVELLRKT